RIVGNPGGIRHGSRHGRQEQAAQRGDEKTYQPAAGICKMRESGDTQYALHGIARVNGLVISGRRVLSTKPRLVHAEFLASSLWPARAERSEADEDRCDLPAQCRLRSGLQFFELSLERLFVFHGHAVDEQ